MITANSKNQCSSSFSIDLLTKVLVEYPVINTVNIDLKSNMLVISFLIKKEITNNEWNETRKVISQKVRLFNQLEKNDSFYFEIVKQSHDNLTKIKLNNKLEQLTKSKIDFLIRTITDSFSEELLIERIERTKFKLKSIEKLLAGAKIEENDKYFGFREGNKIIIYNITA